MRETDKVRRFYVREVGEFGMPPEKRGWEIADRTEFLDPTFFTASGRGGDSLEKARERAVEVAQARNECEQEGHALEQGDCSRCDATITPDVVRRR